MTEKKCPEGKKYYDVDCYKCKHMEKCLSGIGDIA